MSNAALKRAWGARPLAIGMVGLCLVLLAALCQPFGAFASEVDTGSVSFTKEVDGTGASLVPADAEYTIEYTVDGGAPQTATVTAGQTVTIDDLPIGATIEFTETNFPTLTGATWTDAQFIVDGERQMQTSVSSEPRHVTLVNTAAANPPRRTGSVSFTKEVDGTGASLVPADAEYTIEYTVDGGAPQTATVTAGQTVTIDDLPIGATIEFTETNFPTLTGATWTDAQFIVDGEPAETATVDSDEPVRVVLLNTAAVAAPQPTPTPTPTPMLSADLAETGGSDLTALFALGVAAILLGLAARLRSRSSAG